MLNKIIAILLFVICFLYSATVQSTPSDSLNALHYSISLDLTDFTNKTISGKTDIVMQAKYNNVQNIQLELLNLTIDSVCLNNKKSSTYSYNDTLLYIQTTPLHLADSINITVYYNGKPYFGSWGGFYFEEDIAYNLGINLYGNPPGAGKTWFPCIDNFTDKAEYDFNITTATNHIAICNGELISKENNNDTSITYHWTLDKQIPTYLASLAVGDFVEVEYTYYGLLDTISISVFVKQTDSLKAVNSFANITKTIQGYESAFGPYVWNRIGYVSTKRGAMEHVTNIAIPSTMIDGSLNHEWLYAHELAHHWFGDLVTCEKASEMWINEGWAVFSEFIFVEKVYGKEQAKDYVRNKLQEVLQFSHIIDDGYLSISDVPAEYTYGATVYDKGGIVVHSLRGYMGDSLFFSTVKSYLDSFAYKTINTNELKEYFSSKSGIDLEDFFDFWVSSPGFSHFSVDSFTINQVGANYETEVFLRQSLVGTDKFASSNRIELSFMDESFNSYTDTIFFSGEYGSKIFTLPFAPKIVMVDKEAKLCDATTDSYKTCTSVGEYEYANSFFTANVSSIEDSVFIRATHNWVAPKGFNNRTNLRISDRRYWLIEGVSTDKLSCSGNFIYSKGNNLDNNLITSFNKDSLCMLYRMSVKEEWKVIPHTFSASSNAFTGEIIIDSLLCGQYALGYGDWQSHLNISKKEALKDLILCISPNPSSSEFKISSTNIDNGIIRITNLSGVVLFAKTITKNIPFIVWQPATYNKKGIYFVELVVDNTSVVVKKIVLQ